MSPSIGRHRLWNADYTVVATTTITLLGFTLEALAFWPGLMSVDSVVQYTQAVLRHYSDQHPPVMAWLWSWTNRVVPGPGGMLIVHLGLLWIGLWAIAEGARRRGLRHAWIVPLVGFMPTIANIAGVVWKDIGMAYALLCAGGLLYASHRVKRPKRLVALTAALILMAYATMVRANAAAATLAVACYWVAVAFPRARLRRAVVGGVALIALLLVVQQIVERKALSASHQYLSQLVLLFDLTGIACGGADVQIPDAFRVSTDKADMLCKAYDPDQVDKLFFFPDSPLRVSYDEGAYKQLRTVWLATILAHPRLYINHHARAFSGLLGIRRASANDRALRQPFMQPNPWGFTFTSNLLSRGVDATTDALADSGIFSGLLWLSLAVVLLVIIARKRMPLAFESALLASALMYFLPYFFLSLAPNYRFIYWSVLATSVAGVLVALRLIERAIAGVDGQRGTSRTKSGSRAPPEPSLPTAGRAGTMAADGETFKCAPPSRRTDWRSRLRSALGFRFS